MEDFYEPKQFTFRKARTAERLIPIRAEKLRPGDHLRYNGDVMYSYPATHTVEASGYTRKIGKVEYDPEYKIVTLRPSIWPFALKRTLLAEDTVWIRADNGGIYR